MYRMADLRQERQAADALFEGKDVLVSLPNGFVKSLVTVLLRTLLVVFQAFSFGRNPLCLAACIALLEYWSTTEFVVIG